MRDETGAEVEASLGEAIQILRASVGWNQAELAKRARVRPSALSQYEADKQVPGLPSLVRILEAMGYRLSELDTSRDFLVHLKSVRRRKSRPFSLEARAPGGPLSEQVRAMAVQAGYPLPEDRAKAVELWARLQKYKSQEARLALVAEMKEFQIWSLCEILSHESENAAAEDPTAAIDSRVWPWMWRTGFPGRSHNVHAFAATRGITLETP